MQFLPFSKIPDGVFEIANEMRSTVAILKTWKSRNKNKLSGCSEPEVRVLYFGCKIEETTTKAVSIIGMQYYKLYRSLRNRGEKRTHSLRYHSKVSLLLCGDCGPYRIILCVMSLYIEPNCTPNP